MEEGANYSYSIDTVRKLRTGLAAEDELYFIIGADAFAEITSWYRWQEVVQSVRFIVVSRPGHVYQVPAGATVERLDQIELPISSSGIRAALARGERPTGLPAPVMEYIVAHGLYGANVPV